MIKGSKVQRFKGSKSQVPNSKFQVPNSKYQIPNPKFQIPRSGKDLKAIE
jgi:hypothetical protein